MNVAEIKTVNQALFSPEAARNMYEGLSSANSSSEFTSTRYCYSITVSCVFYVCVIAGLALAHKNQTGQCKGQ